MSSEPALLGRTRRRAHPRRPAGAADPGRAGDGADALRQRGRAPARGRRADARRAGGGVPARLPPLRRVRARARAGRDAGGASGARRDRSATSRSTGTRRTGCAPCSCPASTIALDGGRRVTVVTFEDVTALEGARRRSSLLADELRVMLDNVADAITVQSPDHKLIYANEAAARYYGIPRGQALRDVRRRGATCSASRPPTSSGARWTSRGCPGGSRWRGSIPSRSTRALARARDRRGPLGADQGDRGARPRRRRAAGDQRDRGHHRAQALRGVAALPGRGVAAALGLLAGLRAHAGGGDRARGAGAGRPLRRRPGRRRRRVAAEVARGDADRRGVAGAARG